MCNSATYSVISIWAVLVRLLQGVTFDKITLVLVLVMAWCCQATSHYLNQCWWPSSMSPYSVTRGQRVNAIHDHTVTPTQKLSKTKYLSECDCCHFSKTMRWPSQWAVLSSELYNLVDSAQLLPRPFHACPMALLWKDLIPKKSVD